MALVWQAPFPGPGPGAQPGEHCLCDSPVLQSLRPAAPRGGSLGRWRALTCPHVPGPGPLRHLRAVHGRPSMCLAAFHGRCGPGWACFGLAEDCGSGTQWRPAWNLWWWCWRSRLWLSPMCLVHLSWWGVVPLLSVGTEWGCPLTQALFHLRISVYVMSSCRTAGRAG